METITIRQVLLPAAILLIMSYSVFAQDKKKFTVTPGADIVSSYVWRGMALGVIHPCATARSGPTRFSVSAP